MLVCGGELRIHMSLLSWSFVEIIHCFVTGGSGVRESRHIPAGPFAVWGREGTR